VTLGPPQGYAWLRESLTVRKSQGLQSSRRRQGDEPAMTQGMPPAPPEAEVIKLARLAAQMTPAQAA